MSQLIDENGRMRNSLYENLDTIIDIPRLKAYLAEMSIEDVYVVCMELIGLIDTTLSETILKKRYERNKII